MRAIEYVDKYIGQFPDVEGRKLAKTWAELKSLMIRDLEMLDEIAQLKAENQKLRGIIYDGGLWPHCINGWDEIKFCSIRNEDGDACLECFKK